MCCAMPVPLMTKGRGVSVWQDRGRGCGGLGEGGGRGELGREEWVVKWGERIKKEGEGRGKYVPPGCTLKAVKPFPPCFSTNAVVNSMLANLLCPYDAQRS